MPLFYPTVAVRRVTGVTPELLENLGVRALLLDVDNTLTTHNHPEPREEVLLWMKEMRRAGIKLMLVSNNRDLRVRPFAAKLGIGYAADAKKPLAGGFAKACRELGLSPKQAAVVGDQIFTDILGGNLFGSPTILVELMELEDGPFFRFKRRLERRILRGYRRYRAREKETRG